MPAFDVRDGCLSVERFPVVEGDALAQMEGELCAIVAHFPAFCEHRLDLTVNIFHEGFVDEFLGWAVVGDHVERREGGRFADCRDVEHLFVALCRGTAAFSTAATAAEKA